MKITKRSSIVLVLLLGFGAVMMVAGLPDPALAEMQKMNDDELSEVTGQSGELARVQRKARQFNLFEKLAKSEELRKKIKERTREKVSEKLGDELPDNKLVGQFLDSFLENSVNQFGEGGQPPVSVTREGTIKISEAMTKTLLKTALEQSFSTLSNPGQVLGN